MSNKKNKKEFKDGEWEQVQGFGSMQNLIPILKTTLLILEEQKKMTLAKIEHLKKLREKEKNG